jgi:sulfur transfer complex TusBCD TusB component (DsrH family)
MNNKIVKKGNRYVVVQLEVLVFQELDSYLAYCPALNLSTYGDSLNDAKDAFEDVLKCYLEDSAKMGTLDEDLKAHGWTTNFSINKPTVTPPKQVDLNIPAGMLRQTFNEQFRIPVPSC